MFDFIYEYYVNYRLVRIIYGVGFFAAWAVWAAQSLSAGQVTWLVFGWLPAVFWPIELVVWLWDHGMELWMRFAALLGLSS